ncbi:hypothetical protein TWF694_004600 [Orbilia ellipsospora]|uniref:BTB domain-containing protein n=1 Tax=Orbilia ellipsospora TaxID=2528407 RepID=A0AAV9WVK8_9PEZI
MDNNSLGKRKAEVTSEADNRRATLITLFKDGRFSDVKILVGPDKQCFDLHRAIITLRSRYFDAACREYFEEGRNREIWLQEIEPDVFASIANWMYDGGYDIATPGRPFSHTHLINAYKAADYLQMPGLKQELLENFAKFLQMAATADDEPIKKEKGYEFYSVLQELCAHSQVSQWVNLRTCAHIGLAYTPITKERLLSFSRDHPGSPLALALLVELYQGIVDSLLCATCQPAYVPRNNRNCVKCRKPCGTITTITDADLN